MSLDQRIISSLAHLVTIGVDGEEGYQKAAEMVSNKNLLAQFEQLSTARNIQAEAIRNYLGDNGVEKPAHEGGLGGSLHRAWLDIKGTLSNRSDGVSISSCLSGDQAAVVAYQAVLDETNLPVDLQKLLTEHLEDLKGDVENLEQLSKES